MFVFNAKVKFEKSTSCAILLVVNILCAVNARPQKQNENWILPPSRQESISLNDFQPSKIFNLIDNLWSFDAKKDLVPGLNANDLIKRVGILSTEDGSSKDWEIPASRVENDISEIINKKDMISNKKEDIQQLDMTENLFGSWSKSIPAEIKSSVNTITSGIRNVTQEIKEKLETAQNMLVDNFKNAFYDSGSEAKEPKRETNSNSEEFFADIFDNRFSKFLGSLNIQENLSNFYSKMFTGTNAARSRWAFHQQQWRHNNPEGQYRRRENIH